jgi:transposase
MAPRLAPSQLVMIRDMIDSRSLTTLEMAEAASKRSIITISNNLRMFGDVRAPLIPGGRPRMITPFMLEALCEHLIEKSDLYLDEMADFLYDEFELLVSTYTVSRALRSQGWTKKIARRIAQERNADLRYHYLHQLSDFRSYHLVFIDESGCDKRAGFRRTGWSPRGVTPVQVSRFQRGQRYQILPAYCQDGILMSRVFQGSTDASMFEDFIEQLLHHCGRWPEPKSVLIMDNASFHHTERITELCLNAGVKLLYLPPYSPDLNPIEEFFAELKAFVRRNWQHHIGQDFEDFLEWSLDVVGAKRESAEGHFRHANVVVEEQSD